MKMKLSLTNPSPKSIGQQILQDASNEQTRIANAVQAMQAAFMEESAKVVERAVQKLRSHIDKTKSAAAKLIEQRDQINEALRSTQAVLIKDITSLEKLTGTYINVPVITGESDVK